MLIQQSAISTCHLGTKEVGYRKQKGQQGHGVRAQWQ